MARGLFTCVNVRIGGGQKYASSVDGWLLSAPVAKRSTTNDTGTLTTLWVSTIATGGVVGSFGSIVIWVKWAVSISTRYFLW